MRTIRLRAALAGAGLAAFAGLAIGVVVPRHISNEASIGATVRKYILAHPEIISEALERLRIGSDRAAIETPFPGASAGNAQGDVTLVVFTDYNCPYCRATAGELDRLIASDPKLLVIWRELPVLGPESETAAIAALAAARQNKYPAFHRALFAGNHPDQAGITAAARSAKLDPARFANDRAAPEVAQEISGNLALARRLQITGTPFFVIGNHTYEGAIGYDALRAAITAARKTET